YPICGSFASSCLSIMASSVSSEHAFSAAAEIITKRCNHIGGDVVEAIQAL
ncbi:hypothetical protein CONPUDRAFT_19385, partial [Coniophora puteana RWD-64-598 SS2]